MQTWTKTTSAQFTKQQIGFSSAEKAREGLRRSSLTEEKNIAEVLDRWEFARTSTRLGRRLTPTPKNSARLANESTPIRWTDAQESFSNQCPSPTRNALNRRRLRTSSSHSSATRAARRATAATTRRGWIPTAAGAPTTATTATLGRCLTSGGCGTPKARASRICARSSSASTMCRADRCCASEE